MAGVTADAQNLSPRAQLPIGRVVENIALEAAGGLQFEAGRLEPLLEPSQVGYAELDLGLNGHW